MQGLPSRELVLIGAGHTHLHVLRMWAKSPIPDTRLTLVSATDCATYSGLLPGTLAGQYPPQEMLIDLHRLTQAAGVRLLVAEAAGLDVVGRSVQLHARPPIPFDAASIGVGSVPGGLAGVQQHAGLVSIKPMISFRERLLQRVEACAADPLQVVVVGGGAAGFEVACCVQQFLRGLLRRADITLLEGAAEILPTFRKSTRRLAVKQLQQRGIRCLTGQRISGATADSLLLYGTSPVAADIVVWCTGAAPPPLLSSIPLPRSASGFLLTSRTLQTVANAPVFAVGDCGELQGQPLPRAGVYAVRQGPVLWDNLQRLLSNQPLRLWTPQRDFLSLLAMGDGTAIGQWRRFSGVSSALWKLKDHIDRKFLRMHRPSTGMAAVSVRPHRSGATGTVSAATDGAGRNADAGGPVMRCRGCGGKTASRVLQSVLQRLRAEHASAHPAGTFLQAEDAALLGLDSGPVNMVSVDFFQSFLDDAWLLGRIAAVHAMSDLWARGVDPAAAMALVTIPSGRAEAQSELLYQLLSGGIRELQSAGATLLGGHTLDGDELSVGFVVLGNTGGQPPLQKAGCGPGDQLVLTRPLGTGVILAALARGQATAVGMRGLLNCMLHTNRSASLIARRCGLRSATDVTGFGLAGHLGEMLDAGGCVAELRLSSLPLLPDAARCFGAGLRSSLHAENYRAVKPCLQASHAAETHAAWPALFDPQTAGGLLLAVPRQQISQVLQELRAAGHAQASVIGQILPALASPSAITVTL